MADIVEDFEDATLNFTFTGSWDRISGTAHSGTWAYRASPIGDNTSMQAVMTVPPGATKLTFWYRVSSEAGDSLRVLLNGSTQIVFVSGEVGWTQATANLAGVSQVTFVYAKNGSLASGADTAWIDDIVVTMPDTSNGWGPVPLF